ncbi:HdeD family acid-resistance protein [Sphingomonas daechungensis]|uniref:HdeD family acid-resistance protein n=1 Tax=Sphingomonas daechungensis TaxID=1176646 RepID=UPI0031F15F02
MEQTAEASAEPAASAPPVASKGPSPIISRLMGLLFIVAGVVALSTPVHSTMLMTMFIGASLLIAGGAQIAHAFSKSWGSLILHIILGLAYALVGAIFLFDPIGGAVVLTKFLAWLLLIQGVSQAWLAFTARPAHNWGWLLVSGIVAFLAGLWLLMRWPIFAFTMPGFILGISLIFEGWAFLLMRRKADDHTPAPASA